MPSPGPASPELVADMKHFCRGPDGLADMKPWLFRELNVSSRRVSSRRHAMR
jgi:hypothetical protein